MLYSLLPRFSFSYSSFLLFFFKDIILSQNLVTTSPFKRSQFLLMACMQATHCNQLILECSVTTHKRLYITKVGIQGEILVALRMQLPGKQRTKNTTSFICWCVASLRRVYTLSFQLDDKQKKRLKISQSEHRKPTENSQKGA